MATTGNKIPVLNKKTTTKAVEKVTSKKAAVDTGKTAKKPVASLLKKIAAKPVIKKGVEVKIAPLESKTAKKIAVKKPASVKKSATVTPEQRYQMIATAAYFLAESRGFAGGYEMQDWISAEAATDAKLAA
ncbi:MAG: DUF2934 domain-containing protein [Gallionellaceae bacterium]|jgi:hypothetical protein